MGFGLLLIGYFIAFIIPVWQQLALAMPLGYAVILAALTLLAPYAKGFSLTRGVTFAALPVSLYFAVTGTASWGVFTLPAWLTAPALSTAAEWYYFLFVLAFHVCLLRTLAAFTGEMGLSSLRQMSWRNLLIVLIYQALFLILSLLLPLFSRYGGLFVLPLTLLRFVFVFLDIYLFFRCYRLILPEGSDAAVPEKKTDKEDQT